MGLEIREVTTGADRKTFIYLPEKIHAGQAQWVHPIYMDEKKYFDPKKNTAFEYCDVGLWLAWRDGTAVGRVMGIINRRFNAHRKEEIARFACLECYEDRDVFQALVRTVEVWAKAKGATRMIGPYGFSDQDPEGWLTMGFEHRATIATYYNFEWMPRFIEEMGYGKDVDYFVYKIPLPKEMPELYTKVFERSMKRGSFVLHEFTRRKDLKPWVVPIFSLMNECYMNSNIYGYAPLTEKEMQDLAKRYLPVVDPRFVKLVTKDGRPASFIIAMPDMTEGIRKARGPAVAVRLPQGPAGGQEDQAARPPPRGDQARPPGRGPGRRDGLRDVSLGHGRRDGVHGHPPRARVEREDPGGDDPPGRRPLQEVPGLDQAPLIARTI